SVFPRVRNDYRVDLRATTFEVPSTFGPGDSLEVIISGGDADWVQCDGVQMVDGNRPSVYMLEDSGWNTVLGHYNIRVHQRMIWFGALYPNLEHNIRPSKNLRDCRNGWIVQWQRYSGGSTSNSNFQFTYIPKAFDEGLGLRI